MVAWRIATLGLALIASAVAAAPRLGGTEALVILDDLELMVEPTDSAYSTGALRRGDRVTLLATQPGWAQVETPAHNFHWINAAEVEDRPDGTCVVSRRQASVRYGSDSARVPGPPVRTVRRGAVVRPIDHPVLKVEGGDKPQVWRAIEATDDAVRYLPIDGLRVLTPAAERPPPAAGPDPVPSRPERRVSHEVEAEEPALPPAVAAELTSIAAMERSVRSAPLETWNLDPVRGRYEALLRQFGTDPQVLAVVNSRLDRARREADLARSAQEFARLLREGDRRDHELAQVRRSMTLARTRSEREYDAQGLLQPSSRTCNGEKVLALIGPEGRPISYLTIPPGIPVRRYLARKVGVRGIVHFEEELGARLISVRDLDLIEPAR